MKNSWTKLLMTLYCHLFVLEFVHCNFFCSRPWCSRFVRFSTELLWSIYDLLIIFSLLSRSPFLKSDLFFFFSHWNLYCCVGFIHSQALFVPIFSFYTLSFQLIYFLLFYYYYYNAIEGANHVSFLVFPMYVQYTIVKQLI